MLKNGDKAPLFSAPISENQQLSLSDLKGKYVVLYFYPKDNTPGCTVEAQGFESLYDEFKKLSVEIVGVSKDSLKSHSNFCTKYGLRFKLISDKEGEICQKYHVWVEKSMFGKKYMGIKRSTFLINPEGIIEYIWHSVSVKGHGQEVMKKIQELKL